MNPTENTPNHDGGPAVSAWENNLIERERNELRFAQMYAEHYNHGTDGHSRLLLIAKLANLLNTRGE